ncbi:hypothetical protein BG011_009317 [Mortierella polycephala]|uniref:Uncharacterized protein n=1 Tax=Mortierella polycephala TaxID=41804 RepID=A0A9P6PPG1_9FUNG|nr:hypothetical protein BG011_009317 [Mortierella polycephala]
MPSSSKSSDSVMEIEPSIDTMMPTFRFMVHRKLRRKAHGQYKRHSSRRYYFSAFVIGLFLTLVGLGAQKLELATSWPQLFLLIILLLAMIYIVVKVSIVVRWCFYWLVLATLVLFAFNSGTIFEKFKAQPSQDPDTNIKLGVKIVLIILALLECLTIGIVVFLRVAYPRIMLRAQWLNCKRWWRIRDTPRPLSISANYKTIMFSYLSWDPDEYRFVRSSISYVGEFDEFGQPHGLGEWTDHTFTGEALQGIWGHGVPIGPFKSQEYGTGNAFSSIRIGFCKNSTDRNNSTTFGAARDPNGISYGAAAVECSVSGKFFHHLPHARIIGAPVLRSELERKAKEEGGTTTIVLAHPLSFLSTFAESLQSRPSVRGSFRAMSSLSKKTAPLSKSIVIRYTDQGILIPGYIRSSRRKTDVNEVLIRRVYSPNLGIEGQQFRAADNSDAGVEAPHSQDTVPTLALPSSNRSGGGSATSEASDDSDSSHVKRLLVPEEGSDQVRRSFDNDRKKRIHQQVGLVAKGWRQVLDVDGRVSSTMAAAQAGHEALIFIHGYNCPLTYGIARLGQLLSLGEFPPYIKPFVFNWPSSTTMGYFNAKKVGCSDDVAKDLRQLIADLREAGFQRVHILAHSMGARIVLSALRKGYLNDVLAEREVMADGEPSLMSSVIESETQLKARRKSVRYRDSVSGAPRPQSSASLHEDGHLTGPAQLASFTLLNPDADLDIFLEDDYWTLSKYCPHITLYADARDGALFWSEVLTRKKSLGRHPRTLVYKPTGEALDVDVIDTTSLDVNIHSLRHNFFNLNRMLVDDLYDVVVLGRQAREREGRLSSRWTFSTEGIENGEVYTFLCAPSYVVNK